MPWPVEAFAACCAHPSRRWAGCAGRAARPSHVGERWWGEALVLALLLAQTLCGARVLARLARTAGGQRIRVAERAPHQAGAVTAVVPVLDERRRLAPCLDGLIGQGPELREIVVVDGGSTDGTQALARAYQARDRRVRLVDASPVPAAWNGKAWGLEVGARVAAPASRWLLTVDADVRPRPPLVRSLLAHATRHGLDALSVAAAQELAGCGTALVHPALLATLVYRYGIPGHATDRASAAQANGQCMLLRREALARVGGFEAVRASRCEDVTLARALAALDMQVGFYESDGLVSARMYEGGWEALTSWPRSLPLRDRFTRWSALTGLAEVTLVQALPLAVLALSAARGARSRSPVGRAPQLPPRAPTHGRRGARRTPLAREAQLAHGGARAASGALPPLDRRGSRRPGPSAPDRIGGWSGRSRRWLVAVNVALLLTRLGVLAGTARAYPRRPPVFWLSPLLDLPVALQLWRSILAREPRWRGRRLVPGAVA